MLAQTATMFYNLQLLALVVVLATAPSCSFGRQCAMQSTTLITSASAYDLTSFSEIFTRDGVGDFGATQGWRTIGSPVLQIGPEMLGVFFDDGAGLAFRTQNTTGHIVMLAVGPKVGGTGKVFPCTATVKPWTPTSNSSLVEIFYVGERDATNKLSPLFYVRVENGTLGQLELVANLSPSAPEPLTIFTEPTVVCADVNNDGAVDAFLFRPLAFSARPAAPVWFRNPYPAYNSSTQWTNTTVSQLPRTGLQIASSCFGKFLATSSFALVYLHWNTPFLAYTLPGTANFTVVRLASSAGTFSNDLACVQNVTSDVSGTVSTEIVASEFSFSLPFEWLPVADSVVLQRMRIGQGLSSSLDFSSFSSSVIMDVNQDGFLDVLGGDRRSVTFVCNCVL